MIGLTSLTTSPSSVVSRRSTPCVAGWCGPMLIVNSSCSSDRSLSITASVSATGWSSSRSIDTERSRSRYGALVGSVIPARVLVLVVGEQDGLAPHREVASLREALVVLRHQDPAQVGVAVEDDAEHIVDLALLEVGGREQVDHRRQAWVVDPESGLHVQPVLALHGQELVVHAQARLLGEVVAAVQAGQ